MVGGNQDGVPVGELTTADARDWRIGLEQTLRGKLAERDDDTRLDDVDLAKQEWLALLHFVGLGIAVPRWSTLDDVSDVDVLARQLDGLDDLRQQLAGAADEWLALDVFVGARRLADEHQVGVRVADAKHHLLAAGRVQLAAAAVAPDVAARGVERLGHRAVVSGFSRTFLRVRLKADTTGRFFAAAPVGVEAQTVDAHLAEKCEVIANRVARHGQRRAGAAGRALRRASTRSSIRAATRSFACSGTTSSPSAVISVTSLVGASKPRSLRDTSLATIISTFFRARLARARPTTSPVSAANPTRTGAEPPSASRIAPRSARMSFVRSSISVSGASVLASLSPARCAGA